jgi:galactonate dehydratase
MASQHQIGAVDIHAVPVSDKTTWLFLEVEFTNGSTGFGEASFFREESSVIANARHISEIVKQEALEPLEPALARFRTIHTPPSMRCTLSALEQAMLGAIAQTAGLPLGIMLGGNHRRSVPVYANINRGVIERSPESFAKAALMAKKLGYQAFKLAPFDGLRWQETEIERQKQLFDAGLARVAAVREAIGDDMQLLVDCHWRFDRPLANRAIGALSEFKPFWIEDMVDPGLASSRDQRRLRDLAHSKNILTAGGENVWTMRDAVELLNHGGLDVMLPDLRYTGILPALSILELAVAHGVKTSLHNPAGPVLDAVSLQVAAALPGLLIMERQVNESPLYDAVIEDPLPLTNGNLEVTNAPGLGIEFDRQELKSHSMSADSADEGLRSVGGGPNA